MKNKLFLVALTLILGCHSSIPEGKTCTSDHCDINTKRCENVCRRADYLKCNSDLESCTSDCIERSRMSDGFIRCSMDSNICNEIASCVSRFPKDKDSQ